MHCAYRLFYGQLKPQNSPIPEPIKVLLKNNLLKKIYMQARIMCGRLVPILTTYRQSINLSAQQLKVIIIKNITAAESRVTTLLKEWEKGFFFLQAKPYTFEISRTYLEERTSFRLLSWTIQQCVHSTFCELIQKQTGQKLILKFVYCSDSSGLENHVIIAPQGQ